MEARDLDRLHKYAQIVHSGDTENFLNDLPPQKWRDLVKVCKETKTPITTLPGWLKYSEKVRKYQKEQLINAKKGPETQDRYKDRLDFLKATGVNMAATKEAISNLILALFYLVCIAGLLIWWFLC